MVQIKLLTKDELNNALELVWRVFQDYEAVNYPESGKTAFYEAIHLEEYLKQLAAYGAFIDDKLVGIIATRNNGSHIALFFVDGDYHRQGIGRKLWEAVLAENTSEVITVNPSLYAEEVYKSLGFAAKADMQEEGGIKYIPMEYLLLLDMLQDKDDNKAYAKTKEVAAKSEESDEYYKYTEDFARLLTHKKSYVRTRAFILCCSQARWDTEGRIKNILTQMMLLLHDPKPTVVRQCLNAIKEVVAFRRSLCGEIRAELSTIDLSKYKDSMSPLIEKDVAELREEITQILEE